MALPTPVTKQHMDEAGDDPKLARAELAALADALNALLTHLGLSTITSGPLTVGQALEAASGALRVKLDGDTLARSAAGLKLNVPVAVASGGTGAGDATQARANLGLGSMATQNADSVVITGGSATFTASPTVRVAAGAASAIFHADHATSGTFGAINFNQDDTGGTEDTLAQILVESTDLTAGGQDATLQLRTMVAGGRSTRATVGAGLYMTGATGGDPGAGKINAQDFLINGVPVFSQSLGDPGYVKFANGLAVQWGGQVVGAGAAVNVTLPIAYTTSHHVAIAGPLNVSPSDSNTYATPNGLTRVTLTNKTGVTQTIRFLSLGV